MLRCLIPIESQLNPIEIALKASFDAQLKLAFDAFAFDAFAQLKLAFAFALKLAFALDSKPKPSSSLSLACLASQAQLKLELELCCLELGFPSQAACCLA